VYAGWARPTFELRGRCAGPVVQQVLACAAHIYRCGADLCGVLGATADDGDQSVRPPLPVRCGRAPAARRRLPDLPRASRERPRHLRLVILAGSMMMASAKLTYTKCWQLSTDCTFHSRYLSSYGTWMP
jgi:hypothetical protein